MIKTRVPFVCIHCGSVGEYNPCPDRLADKCLRCDGVSERELQLNYIEQLKKNPPHYVKE